METYLLIYELIDSTSGCAPEMTHALCSLGGGDMGSGIIALWEAGQKTGMMKGAAISSLAFSAGIACAAIIRRRRKKRIREIEMRKEGENA